MIKRLNQGGGMALFIIVLLVVAGGCGYYVYRQNAKDPGVDSYAKCVAAGGAIQESYPEVCAVDGHSYPNPDQKFDQPNE